MVISFEEWMCDLEDFLDEDLDDDDWYCFYEDGMTPEEAIQESGENDFDW